MVTTVLRHFREIKFPVDNSNPLRMCGLSAEFPNAAASQLIIGRMF